MSSPGLLPYPTISLLLLAFDVEKNPKEVYNRKLSLAEVGVSLGVDDGLAVGVPVGELVGVELGDAVGEIVGVFDGEMLGLSVGEAVGVAVALGVGEDVADGDTCRPYITGQTEDTNTTP